MSDIDTGAAAPPAPAAPPAGGGEAPSPAAPPPASPPPAAGFDGIDYDALEAESGSWTPEQSTEQIRRLRNEHKTYRERFSPYQKALAPYDETSQQTWLRVMEYSRPRDDGEPEHLFQARQAEVARFFMQNARQFAGESYADMYGEFGPEAAAPADEGAPASEIPSDPAEFQSWMQQRIDEGVQAALSQRDSASQAQQAQERIASVMDELGGYKKGDPHWNNVLDYASREETEDIEAALRAGHEKYQEWLRNEGLKLLEAKPAAAARKTTAPPPPAAAAPNGSGQQQRRLSGREKMLSDWESGRFRPPGAV